MPHFPRPHFTMLHNRVHHPHTTTNIIRTRGDKRGVDWSGQEWERRHERIPIHYNRQHYNRQYYTRSRHTPNHTPSQEAEREGEGGPH